MPPEQDEPPSWFPALLAAIQSAAGQPSTNGWSEHALLVLAEIKRANEERQQCKDARAVIVQDIGKLKTAVAEQKLSTGQFARVIAIATIIATALSSVVSWLIARNP